MSGVSLDFVFDFKSDIRVVSQENLGVFAALAEFFSVIGEPGAGFFDNVCFNSEIQQFSGFGDTFAVHNVEVDDFERRSHFVFDDFDSGLAADDIFLIFNFSDAADINAYRGIKF